MNRLRAIVLCVILVLVGSALVVVSGRTTPTTAPELSPRPSPTWALMPPRAPRPTELEAAAKTDYLHFYRALLRGELGEAEQIWVALRDLGYGSKQELTIAGARLALAQGNLPRAEARTWDAIGQSPDDALVWSLLGIVLGRSGQPRQAEQAFAIAQSLDPGLASDVLPSRWQAAVASGDPAVVVALAEAFGNRHPDSVFTSYYRAEAFLLADAPSDAIALLVGVLTEEPSAPALLWYTLGRAYLARGGYSEAAISLEAAALRSARGDTSLELVSPHPNEALNALLGEAYLQTARCAEAESIFRRLESSQPGYRSMAEAAVICQTPTPTLTPWIPLQIGTVTPRP